MIRFDPRKNHSRSLRFLTLVTVGMAILYGLKRLGVSPFSGFTYLATTLLFTLALHRGNRARIPLIGIAFLGIAQFLLFQFLPQVSVHPICLLGFQGALFSVWTLWLFRYHPWSKDLFTVWTVSGILELAIAPPVTFAQELLGFGSLILITLWILVETDRIGENLTP
ncbi:MAG: hypothetical protein H6752_20325 [Candidatus Omnitrophica bacterium]|nr:hypothetical protein [Candidatus Omnitrophota bacterium]